MGGVDGKGIRLISEPEAAAVYTLKAIQPNNLSVGDSFVVCDAGGGTVVCFPPLLLFTLNIAKADRT